MVQLISVEIKANDLQSLSRSLKQIIKERKSTPGKVIKGSRLPKNFTQHFRLYRSFVVIWCGKTCTTLYAEIRHSNVINFYSELGLLISLLTVVFYYIYCSWIPSRHGTFSLSPTLIIESSWEVIGLRVGGDMGRQLTGIRTYDFWLEATLAKRLTHLSRFLLDW